MCNVRIGVIVVALLLCGTLTRADDTPATQPTTAPSSSILHPGDKDAVAAAADKDVTIEGVIDQAAWSSSGKVMKATFKDGGETKLAAIIFSSNKDKFDKAFGGDVTKALTGAKVRLKGHLKDYKGSPEIVLDNVDQLTIVEAASPDAAASQPSRDER
jgi:DNA/RNA endonuclease YhcR with UshA esterase domain